MAKPNTSRKAPLAEQRGLRPPLMLDTSLFAFMLRGNIEDVAGAFVRELKAKRWKKAVPLADLPEWDWSSKRVSYYPFQLRGHSWTTLTHTFRVPQKFSIGSWKRIAEHLGTRAIIAGHSDSAGTFDYLLYDSAKLAEIFHWHGPKPFHAFTPEEFERLERGLISPPPEYCAASRVRELDVADHKALQGKKGKAFVEHLHRLFDGFFRSQNAFLAFNRYPDRPYFPPDEATDEDIVRIDFVEV